MDIIIGLIPALSWGLIPLFVSKIGGKPINQVLGTTAGTFIVGLIVFIIKQPDIKPVVFLFSFLSGVSWASGQMLLYTAYTKIGVSKATPLTTAMQLTGTCLMGVLIFGEWPGITSKLIGFGAIILIMIGAIISTYKEKTSDNSDSVSSTGSNMKSGVIILLISTLGYVGYSGFPRAVSADGWAEFFPQTIGMLSVSIVIALFTTHGKALKEISSYKNIVSGLVFGIGALAYLISTATNGIAVGFALSQMNVVIATWGSILYLKEKKTHKELIAVFIGLALVVCGGIAVNFI